MRVRSYSLILAALFLLSVSLLPAFAQDKPVTPAAGADPAKVEAFLKNLGDAVSIGNHMRVASFVKYPVDAWIDGEKHTFHGDNELFVHYRQIFDKSLQQSLATARADSFVKGPDGMTVCGGRLVVGQVGDKNTALKIVKIGDAATR